MELNGLGRQTLERRDSRLVREASKPYTSNVCDTDTARWSSEVFPGCSGLPPTLTRTPTPEKTHPVLSKALPTSLTSTNRLQILLLLLLSPLRPVQ